MQLLVGVGGIFSIFAGKRQGIFLLKRDRESTVKMQGILLLAECGNHIVV